MVDRSAQVKVFPREMGLKRVDPACNMKRFYRMTVERDLFGGSSLIREWGRIGRGGQVLIESHADEGQAINALMKLTRSKRRRGYGAEQSPA